MSRQVGLGREVPQGRGHGHLTRAVTQGSLCLDERSAVAVWKFLILSEPGAPHFHFALGCSVMQLVVAA